MVPYFSRRSNENHHVAESMQITPSCLWGWSQMHSPLFVRVESVWKRILMSIEWFNWNDCKVLKLALSLNCTNTGGCPIYFFMFQNFFLEHQRLNRAASVLSRRKSAFLKRQSLNPLAWRRHQCCSQCAEQKVRTQWNMKSEFQYTLIEFALCRQQKKRCCQNWSCCLQYLQSYL